MSPTDIYVDVFTALCLLFGWSFRRVLMWQIALFNAGIYAIVLVPNIIIWHSLNYVVLDSIGVAMYGYICWKNRPKGKGRKAAKLIGAKAKAIRDKLVAAMPHPSPVPLPTPA